MPAGKHGSSEITISYDDGPGGTLRLITSFILTISGITAGFDTFVAAMSIAYGLMVATVLVPGGLRRTASRASSVSTCR